MQTFAPASMTNGSAFAGLVQPVGYNPGSGGLVETGLGVGIVHLAIPDLRRPRLGWLQGVRFDTAT